ncbi:MAG: hypothetical protein VCC04_05135 [Myxococcota bacterium]
MNHDFAIPLMWVTGVLVAAVFAVVVSAAQGAAVMAGLGLGLINYQLLYRGAVRFFEAVQAEVVGRRAWLLMAVLRLGLLAVGLALLLKLGCPPLGLVVGLSVPVFSQVVWSTYRAFQRSAASGSEQTP